MSLPLILITLIGGTGLAWALWHRFTETHPAQRLYWTWIGIVSACTLGIAVTLTLADDTSIWHGLAIWLAIGSGYGAGRTRGYRP